MYQMLATGIVAIHLGYVGFVVVAQLLILLGIACRWQWTRNLRFRVTHLIMTEIVALEGLFSVRCPITDWQDRIEAAARAANAAPIGNGVQEPVRPLVGDNVKPLPPATVVDTQSRDPRQRPDEPLPSTAPKQQESTAVSPKNEVPERAPPVMPTEPSSPDDDGSTTFVGRMLNAILFLPVDQSVLDTWYVRFGAATLLIFVAYPPRLGTWSPAGFCGMILLWVGCFTALSAWYDLKITTYPRASQLPFEIGVVMTLLGAQFCLLAWRGRRVGQEKSMN